jgi:hypothetical protein
MLFRGAQRCAAGNAIRRNHYKWASLTTYAALSHGWPLKSREFYDIVMTEDVPWFSLVLIAPRHSTDCCMDSSPPNDRTNNSEQISTPELATSIDEDNVRIAATALRDMRAGASNANRGSPPIAPSASRPFS